MTKVKWSMDPTHSEVQFKVRHLMVSWVTGSFQKFAIEAETEGTDVTTAHVKFTADLSSISTNNEQRDAHLRSNDFFDAETHPQLTFESNELQKITEEEYSMPGILTMRGVSKPITFKVDFGGIMKDPWGNTRTGFTVSGKLNRKDFGVSFSLLSESGGVLLGDEVTINANAEFVSTEKVL